MNRNTMLLQLWVASLGALLLAGAAALVLLTDDAALASIGVALLALATVAIYTRPVARAQEIAPVAAASLFAVAILAHASVAELEMGRYAVLPAVVAAAVLLGVWYLAKRYTQAETALESELAARGQAIREMSRYDVVSGAIEPRFGQQLLSEEVERSRRYHHSMTLMLVGIDDWPRVHAQRGKADANGLLRSMVDLLVEVLRTTDRVVQHSDSTFALVLAETPLPGAAVLAERLAAHVHDELGVTVRFGMAEFPHDAITVSDLVIESEQALQFARVARLPSANRELLLR